MITTYQGRRILIIGAARQGQALARYLTRQGALVTINDQKSADDLKTITYNLADLPVRWVLGSHPTELLDDTDLVCLSGGVPLTLPIVAEAVRRGLPISNDSQIFLESVPCRVIGITGSAGKTTTTTLVGRMAESAICLPHKAWVGGNIGLPLIDYLEQIQPEDLVILELSSFQLDQITISPQVAAILNITPNHLDRHGSLDRYTAAKVRILTYQTGQDIAVLGRDDPRLFADLSSRVHGKLVSFGLAGIPDGQTGTYFENGKIYLHQAGNPAIEVMQQNDILLKGDHNLLNVLAACAIAWSAGFPVEAMRSGVVGFGGVAHRLEFVRNYHGADWYNDSIATAPERTMAAIRAFSEPIILLLGGRDKNLPWQDLAELIHQRVEHVIVFGEASQKIVDALEPQKFEKLPQSVSRFHTLKEAISAAADLARAGFVVLLSPGGTSFDEFNDFEERGERYCQWVNQLS
jgi:UDP-N-acetylmuramoylalanine--D-glutamate ligase